MSFSHLLTYLALPCLVLGLVPAGAVAADSALDADPADDPLAELERAVESLEQSVEQGSFTVKDFDHVWDLGDRIWRELETVTKQDEKRIEALDTKLAELEELAGQKGNNAAEQFVSEAERTVAEWMERLDDPFSPTLNEIKRFYDHLDVTLSDYEGEYVFGESHWERMRVVEDQITGRLAENALPEAGIDLLKEYESFAERVSEGTAGRSFRKRYGPLEDFARRRDELLETSRHLRYSPVFDEELNRIEGIVADSLTEFLRERITELERLAESGEFTYRDVLWIRPWRNAADHLRDFSVYPYEELEGRLVEVLERTVLAGNADAERFVSDLEQRAEKILESGGEDDRAASEAAAEAASGPPSGPQSEAERAALREVRGEIVDVFKRMKAHVESHGDAYPAFPYVFSESHMERLIALDKKITEAGIARAR